MLDTVLAFLVPPVLDPFSAGLFTLAAFFTSAMTAAFGVGGGVALLALMSFFMPVPALVPVHGVVQLGSNFGRTVVQIAHVNFRIVGIFLAGSLIGAALGGQVVVALPDKLMKIAIGLFVLWSVWGKKPSLAFGGHAGLAIGGAVSTFLTMFIGATGPFVAASLRLTGLEKLALVATHGASMVVQHGVKIAMFGFLGFAFGPWLGLMGAMIASGFLGTLAGTAILKRLPDGAFRAGFRWVMSAMAIIIILGALHEPVP